MKGSGFPGCNCNEFVHFGHITWYDFWINFTKPAYSWPVTVFDFLTYESIRQIVNPTKREYQKWLDSIRLTQNFRTDIWLDNINLYFTSRTVQKALDGVKLHFCNFSINISFDDPNSFVLNYGYYVDAYLY